MAALLRELVASTVVPITVDIGRAPTCFEGRQKITLAPERIRAGHSPDYFDG